MIAEINNKKIWYTIKGKGEIRILIIPHPVLGSSLFALSFEKCEEWAQVIYFDPVNTGRSKNLNQFQVVSYDSFIDDIEDFRRYLNLDDFILIGHSISGTIAVHYLSKYTVNVKKAILISSGHHLPDMGKELFQRFVTRSKDQKYKNVFNKIEGFILDEQHKKIMKMYTLHFFDPEKILGFLKKVSMSSEKLHPISSEHEKMLIHSEKTLMLNENQLRKVTRPVNVIYGRDDITYNQRRLQDFSNILKDCHISILDNVGHFPWLEDENMFFSELKKIIYN